MPLSNQTRERRRHSEKQFPPIATTEEGTQMKSSDEQSMNASVPIRDNLEHFSNVTDASFSHQQKQYAPSVVTDEGIQIDFTNEPENVDASIQEMAGLLSNAIPERCRHPLTNRPPIVAILDGIQIDLDSGSDGSLD
jgi:hypothetical protein